ncbi:hypothetical protein F5887DRAFT_1160057 [Amanita rubescens]|nr:hypothetical protein F5887DRAFT_1160057 [Amanita rubescens]
MARSWQMDVIRLQTNYFLITDEKEKPGDSVKTVSDQDKNIDDTKPHYASALAREGRMIRRSRRRRFKLTLASPMFSTRIILSGVRGAMNGYSIGTQTENIKSLSLAKISTGLINSVLEKLSSSNLAATLWSKRSFSMLSR